MQERTDIHGLGWRVIRPGEEIRRAILYGLEPEVRATSRLTRDWHLAHWWRWRGCERWVTTIEIQGVERRIVVPGRHVLP